jgi:16S rRNA (cytosine1402-N4)-methyltransferase
MNSLLTSGSSRVYFEAWWEEVDVSGEVIKSAVFGHSPVMVGEVNAWLVRANTSYICDGTVGHGGHAEALLAGMGSRGTLIGIDRDDDALAVCRERLQRFGARVILIKGLFVDVREHLKQVGVSRIDGVLLDLGVSSPQLDDPKRGFSFQSDGPLDMRMDQSTGETAADLLNRLPETELADVIYQYGEERFSRRIARAIVTARENRPFRTTQELVAVIKGAVPSSYRHGRIHCATRTFQALRIAVNQEIETLESALQSATEVLNPGGRLAVISFHSLEDRIVKHTFRALSQGSDARLAVLTKKPQLPSGEESRTNPRARSAKLRVAERISQGTVQ